MAFSDQTVDRVIAFLDDLADMNWATHPSNGEALNGRAASVVDKADQCRPDEAGAPSAISRAVQQ